MPRATPATATTNAPSPTAALSPSALDIEVVYGSIYLVASSASDLEDLVPKPEIRPFYPMRPSTFRRYAIAINETAPELFAALIGRPVTTRVADLADYVAATLDAAHAQRFAPPSPDHHSLNALSPEVSRLAYAFAQSIPDELSETLDALTHLNAALARRFSAPSFPRSLPTSVHHWTSAVRERLATGAQPTFRLLPPESSTDAWVLLSELTSLSDATTTVAATSREAAGIFGCGAHDVTAMAARAWSDLRQVTRRYHELGKVPADLEISDNCVLAIVSNAHELRQRGITLFAPPGLHLPTKVQARSRVLGTPSGLQKIELELSSDLRLVDHEGNESTLSPLELDQLVAAKSNLVELGGRWAVVDLASARAAKLVARSRSKVSAAELLREARLADLDLSGVTGWVGSALRGEAFTAARPHAAPRSFKARLRPYQREGLGWLTWLEETGIGGVLADDMGLGKTVQVLARVLASHSGPTLVVCPTSVIANWAKEATKFAPSLRVAVHHATPRADLATLAASNDLIITSYGVLAKEAAFTDLEWHRVVLDEAQYIKNPATASARAARALRATHRLALTGTPVENHLGDLWSIFAFVEPGLLGSHRDFNRRFLATPSSEDLESLRRLISPLMLRRSKADPLIVPDLPPRIDTRQDCALSAEQVGLYEATTRKLMADLTSAEGIERRGLILAALTRLKMICASPALLVGSPRTEKRSGKFARLVELVTQATDNNEAVLVFSQFASGLAAMATELEAHLGLRVLHFTGQTSAAKRQRIIEEFSQPDGPLVLLISTKAGGVGLNLVRANHVIHYDQWWNPATMDQASDRAWRIGQAKTVHVHHLVCPGTLEERIATLVEQKRAIAASVTGLAALCEMDTEALSELITLNKHQINQEPK